MRKLLVPIAIVGIISSANAGKNVIPAETKPIPVPVAPLGLYIGGGFTYAKGECSCQSVHLTSGYHTPKFTAHTKGFNLKLGYDFNKFFGIEAKYFFTPWQDKDRTMKHYGLYLKPSYPVTEKVDVYALLGYGKTECETLKDSLKGFGWGLGISYNFGERIEGKKKGFGVYLEYLRPVKKTGNKKITIDTINAGVQYNF